MIQQVSPLLLCQRHRGARGFARSPGRPWRFSYRAARPGKAPSRAPARLHPVRPDFPKTPGSEPQIATAADTEAAPRGSQLRGAALADRTGRGPGAEGRRRRRRGTKEDEALAPGPARPGRSP